jgi:hypothetical protein
MPTFNSGSQIDFPFGYNLLVPEVRENTTDDVFSAQKEESCPVAPPQ